MVMETVRLEDKVWDQLQNILGTAPLPWTISNPLLMAIGSQLQAQRTPAQQGSSNGAFDAQRSSTGTFDPANPPNAVGEPAKR